MAPNVTRPLLWNWWGNERQRETHRRVSWASSTFNTWTNRWNFKHLFSIDRQWIQQLSKYTCLQHVMDVTGLHVKCQHSSGRTFSSFKLRKCLWVLSLIFLVYCSIKPFIQTGETGGAGHKPLNLLTHNPAGLDVLVWEQNIHNTHARNSSKTFI